MLRRRSRGLLFAVCLVAAGCGRTAGVSSGRWTEHSDLLGFTVRHPPGWTVETGDGGLVTLHDAGPSRLVLVQPFFLKRPATALECVAEVPRRFAAVFPRGRIVRSQQRRQRPDEVIATLAYTGAGGAGRASLLCSVLGKSGMLYVAAGPEGTFDAEKGHLVEILRSFSYAQPAPAGGGSAGIEYTPFMDPKEGAFWIDVPKGWKVTGGMYRFAPTDTRPALEMVSPDGKIRVTAGDREIPFYALPNPMLTASGFTEGVWYSPGYGVNFMVRRYLTGTEFAAEYATRKFGAICAEVRINERRDRPDLDRQLNVIRTQLLPGFQAQLTTGEVAFTCMRDGQPLRGYSFAGTQMTSAYGTGVWNAQYLHGYLAADDAVETANAVLNRMVESARVNPQWAAMQQSVAAQSSEIVRRTNAEIARITRETYWRRQRTQDYISRQWSNTMLGLADLVDPATGETWQAASGHNYYWRKQGADAIVGTNTYERPDIDFTPLKEW